MSVTREDLESDDADRIKLAGKWSPGVAIVSGANDPRNWDKVKGYGVSGAALRYTSDDLTKFTVQLRLWEPEHFAQWAEWKKLLAKPQSRDKKDANAMRIEHPILADLGISDVVVEDRTQLMQTEDGVWSVTISFLHYRAPRDVLKKANGPIPTDKTNPTARNAAENMVVQLKGTLESVQAEDARL